MFNKNTTEFSSGYFGKLPEFNDFIKFNAGSSEILYIDTWLQEGLAYIRLKFKSIWKEKYDNLPPTSFFLSVPNSEKIVAGVLYAGRDKSSREFPFLIFSILPGKLFTDFHLIPSEIEQMLLTFDEILRRETEIYSLNNSLKNYNITLPQNDLLKHNFSNYLSNTSINDFLIRTHLNQSLLNIKDKMQQELPVIRISFTSDEKHFAFDAGFLIYLLSKKISFSLGHSSIFWNRNPDEQFQLLIFPVNIKAINFVDLLMINCNDDQNIILDFNTEKLPESNNLSENNSSLEEIIRHN